MAAGPAPAPPAVPPLRVLAVIPCPADAPRFDVERAWQSLEQAVQPLCAQGLIELERLAEPTENALRQRLDTRPYHALHFIGHGRARQAAQYATVVFSGSAGNSRAISAQHLGGVLARCPGLRLAVFQACEDTPAPFAGAGEALLAHGIAAVVTTARLPDSAQQPFLRKLYAALVTGSPAGEAVNSAHRALQANGNAQAEVALACACPDAPLVAPRAEPAPASHGPAAIPTAVASAADVVADPAAQRVQQELDRKRAAGEFDVFLCHNWVDKPEVRAIALELMQRGVLPWLDERDLQPGQLWQQQLEQQIERIGAAAVFVGPAGIGGTQELEIYVLMEQFRHRKLPVIPVLLPGAPGPEALPALLRLQHCIDMRAGSAAALDDLLRGITGGRPAR
jgi:hypothetical protein